MEPRNKLLSDARADANLRTSTRTMIFHLAAHEHVSAPLAPTTQCLAMTTTPARAHHVLASFFHPHSPAHRHTTAPRPSLPHHEHRSPIGLANRRSAKPAAWPSTSAKSRESRSDKATNATPYPPSRNPRLPSSASDGKTSSMLRHRQPRRTAET